MTRAGGQAEKATETNQYLRRHHQRIRPLLDIDVVLRTNSPLPGNRWRFLGLGETWGGRYGAQNMNNI